MDSSRLQSIGSFMFIYGLISAALYFVNMNLIIFIWVDLFGDIVGWILRVFIILFGAGLWVLGKFMVK